MGSDRDILNVLHRKSITGEPLEMADFVEMVETVDSAVVVILTPATLVAAHFKDGKFRTCLNQEQMIRLSKQIVELVATGTESIAVRGGHC